MKKPDNDIRICVNFTFFNSTVFRENHPMPVIDYTINLMPGAKYFSKLNCKYGFWQIPLIESSKLLTTSITFFG